VQLDIWISSSTLLTNRMYRLVTKLCDLGLKYYWYEYKLHCNGEEMCINMQTREKGILLSPHKLVDTFYELFKNEATLLVDATTLFVMSDGPDVETGSIVRQYIATILRRVKEPSDSTTMSPLQDTRPSTCLRSYFVLCFLSGIQPTTGWCKKKEECDILTKKTDEMIKQLLISANERLDGETVIDSYAREVKNTLSQHLQSSHINLQAREFLLKRYASVKHALLDMNYNVLAVYAMSTCPLLTTYTSVDGSRWPIPLFMFWRHYNRYQVLEDVNISDCLASLHGFSATNKEILDTINSACIHPTQLSADRLANRLDMWLEKPNEYMVVVYAPLTQEEIEYYTKVESWVQQPKQAFIKPPQSALRLTKNGDTVRRVAFTATDNKIKTLLASPPTVQELSTLYTYYGNGIGFVYTDHNAQGAYSMAKYHQINLGKVRMTVSSHGIIRLTIQEPPPSKPDEFLADYSGGLRVFAPQTLCAVYANRLRQHMDVVSVSEIVEAACQPYKKLISDNKDAAGALLVVIHPDNRESLDLLMDNKSLSGIVDSVLLRVVSV